MDSIKSKIKSKIFENFNEMWSNINAEKFMKILGLRFGEI